LQLSEQLENGIQQIETYYEIKRQSIEPSQKGQLVMPDGEIIWVTSDGFGRTCMHQLVN
jgi:hypothetical protein